MRKVALAVLTLVTVHGIGIAQIQEPDITGVWEGNLHVFEQSIPLVYKISVGTDGKLTAFHDTPDYPLNNVPVDEATL